jgi:hypothetical protein
MKQFSLFTLSLLMLITPYSQAQRLQVSDNHRFLVTETGKPFFWMADTAWELFHSLNREETTFYLESRAAQGFNVVQAVVLAELDGLHTPNAYGATPLTDDDPTKPNAAYFEHVDWVIKKADSLGMYIALLPTWGDKLFKNTWGTGPEIFNPGNAYSYGEWIGKRYRDAPNIIWILGGDRNPRDGSGDTEVWRQMAQGIASGAGGYDNTLMSFHPQPHEGGGSSAWFHKDAWLDMNMHQTGHCPSPDTYAHITHDYSLVPVKPVLDGEPLYEDHPYCFNAREKGYSLPEEIRRIMYWNVFSGACGQTYGCHDVWQMHTQDKEGVNHPLRPWKLALQLPMARQVAYLKNLMLSRPYLSRIPDQDIVAGQQQADENYITATRDQEGRYAMVYFPTGKPALLNLSSLRDTPVNAWWYDPRTGNSFRADGVLKSASLGVVPPSSGRGHDWVLVVDAMAFGAPGQDISGE